MNAIMTVKKSTLLILLVIFFTDTIDAQRTRVQPRDQSRAQSRALPEEGSVKDKLAYSFNLGNLGFSNGGFSVSGKVMAGYKFAKPITAGVHGKVFYDIQSFQGPGNDISLFSAGAGLFARASFLGQFFIQGEYNLTSYDSDPLVNPFVPERDTYTYPMIGGGYESSSGGPWSYGVMLLFNLSSEVRDVAVLGFGEYWITFSFNF